MTQYLKAISITVLLLLLVACSTSQKKPVEKYAKADVVKYLPGTWQYIGFNVAPGSADTTYIEYPNHLGMEDHVIYGIKTDSGSYRHRYDESTNTLLKVEVDPEVELIRFTVSSDSTGIMYPYHSMDTTGGFIGVALNHKLSWYDDEHGQTHLLIYDALSNADDVIIARLNDDEMALDWGNKLIERYRRAVDVPVNQ